MPGDPLQLARAAADGDSAAIGELLEHYLPDLRAFVRLRAGPLVRAREAHSDIVQSVCRDVLAHPDRFRFPDENGFKRWLFTSALRKLVARRDYYLAQRRDAGRDRPLGGDDFGADDERLLAAYHSISTPSRQAMLREEIERIEEAFEQLPEDYREVITLARIARLPRAEIAEQMGRSEGSVRMLLLRALAQLASILNPYPGAADAQPN